MSAFGNTIMIIVYLSDYDKEELATGEIEVEVDLDDYNLIHCDKAKDVIDTYEFLSDLDDDELYGELKRRHMEFEMENYIDFSRDEIETSPDRCKTFLCDILGLMHTVPVETILEEIESRLR